MVDFLVGFCKILMLVLATWKLYDILLKNNSIEDDSELAEITVLLLMHYLIVNETGKQEPEEQEILDALEKYKKWSSANKLPDNFINKLDSALKKLRK